MTAYYNEIDPYAAQWLRNLISAGQIAPGDVDERSIADVRPDDLRGYRQCHFFAGIGVWSYALRRAGWPDERPVWTGSCPCQPFSAAGKGGGFDDERHLWPHFHWLISQCRPDVVLGEQVASKDGLAWLDLVQADLEGTGYATGAVDLCAAGVGAPHIRQRLWWIGERLADAENIGGRERSGCVPSETAAREGKMARQGHGGAAWPNGATSGLDDDARLEGRRGRHQAESGRIGAVRSTSEAGQLGELEDTPGERLEGRPSPGGEQPARSGGLLSPGPSHNAGPDWPGPTNGLWRDADWLFCRDGKWRPVEPRPQSMVDGTAVCLGRIGAGQIRDVELEIAEWSIRHQAEPGEALHDLRRSLSADAERERQAGRLPSLHGAAFLLAFLRQLKGQGWTFAWRTSGASPEIDEANLRVLRHLATLAGAPRQSGLDEQPAGERADALRLLSSILARHAQEAWGRAYDAHAALGFPLAHGAASRGGRLRGYGNAINAEAAVAFIESYLDTLDLTAERFRLTETSVSSAPIGVFA